MMFLSKNASFENIWILHHVLSLFCFFNLLSDRASLATKRTSNVAPEEQVNDLRRASLKL